MRTKLTRTRRSLTAVAGLGLAAALTVACAEEADPTDGAGGLGDDTAGQEAEADEATLTVIGPADGEAVSVPFEVTVDADVELGPVADEVHHLHIWFGDDPTDQEGFELYESAQALVEQAPNGEQTMWVQIHTFDHQPASEPIPVSLTVDGGRDGDADDGSGGRGGPYDY